MTNQSNTTKMTTKDEGYGNSSFLANDYSVRRVLSPP